MDRLVVMTTRVQLHMADKQNTEEKEDILTAVGPGADDDSQETQAPINEGAGDDYEYPEGDDADSPGRHQESRDERTGHSEGADEDDRGLSREQKRRRRKRERYESDLRELAFLRSRNEQLERQRSQDLARIETRQTQSDMLAIDGRISQGESDIREAETLLKQALDAKDTEAAVEALRVRDQLREGLQQLRAAKGQTARAAQERQQAATQTPAQDPAVAMRAQEWAREHTWFDPQARDEDSAIAYTVERRVFNEGRLSPATREYWDEVNRRLARRLPERYRDEDPDDDEDEPERRRSNGNGKPNGNGQRKPSGPTIKVGGRERTLRKGEVFIDEDRKQAMIEAGVWDDPKARARYMKAYQTYDREAGRRPR